MFGGERRYWVALALALLWAVAAHAEEECFEWVGPISTPSQPPHGTAAAVCSATAAYAGYDSASPASGTSSLPTSGSDVGSCDAVYQGSPVPDLWALTATPVECPPRPPCDQDAPEIGQTFSGSASTMATASYCHAVSNCKVSVKQSVGVSGEVIFTGTVTNQNCGDDDPEIPDEDLSEGETCTTGSGGFEVCVNPTGEGQCGYLNDEYVCLKKTPNGGCQSFASGAKVCQAAAGTPPAPDTGTRGEKAAADGTLQQRVPSGAFGSTTTTYNYYAAATVSGSTGQTTPTPEPGDGDAVGEGDGLGDLECPAGMDCSGDLPGSDLEELDSYQAITQNFWNRVNDSPLLGGLSTLGDSMPDGECPATNSVEIFEQDYDFSILCDMWEDVSPVLSLVILAIWCLLAIRILLSA